MPNKGKGGAIELICAVMMWLSVLGGVLGALAFSSVPMVSRSGMTITTATSPILVAYWLIGGLGAAAFWYALSGIGTALRWLELGVLPGALEPDQGGTPPISADGATSRGEESPEPVATADSVLPSKPVEPEVKKTPEQIAAENKSARTTQLVSLAVFIVLGAIFYFSILNK